MKKIIIIISIFITGCNPFWEDVSTTPAPTNKVVLPSATATPAGEVVSVTATSLNIRDGKGNATGFYLSHGTSVSVRFSEDGWAEITEGKYKGLFIWQGCLSENGGFGCQVQ